MPVFWRLAAFCLILSMAGGNARAGETGEARLPETVRQALEKHFPGARIVQWKAKRRHKTPAYELKLSDELNHAEPYKVLLDAKGAVRKEQEHRIAQARLPQALRRAFADWSGHAKGGGRWVVKREDGEPRRFQVEKRYPTASKKYKAYFSEDGRFLKGDAFPGGGAQKSGSKTPESAAPPAPRSSPKETAVKPSAAKPAAEKPRVSTEKENEADGELDPDVLRKVRKLIRGTLAEDASEREKAWRELRDMGNLIVPGLLALYRQKTTSPRMVQSILIALGDSKDPRAGPALVEVLRDKNPRIRRDAARAIGEIRYRAAVPALKKLFANKKESEDVRLSAAVAIAKLGAREGYAELTELLKSPRAGTRTRAVFALGQYGGRTQVKAVARMLSDTEAGVREDAVEALRRIGGKGGRAVQGALITATHDTYYKVRNLAMEVLSGLTGKRLGRDPKKWQEWWAKEQRRGKKDGQKKKLKK